MIGRGEPAEVAELVGEGGEVPLLESIVERAVPRVQQHEHVDRAEVEGDDGGEKTESGPAVLGPPVWQDDPPGVTNESTG